MPVLDGMGPDVVSDVVRQLRHGDVVEAEVVPAVTVDIGRVAPFPICKESVETVTLFPGRP